VAPMLNPHLLQMRSAGSVPLVPQVVRPQACGKAVPQVARLGGTLAQYDRLTQQQKVLQRAGCVAMLQCLRQQQQQQHNLLPHPMAGVGQKAGLKLSACGSGHSPAARATQVTRTSAFRHLQKSTTICCMTQKLTQKTRKP
jgi:hypothetical protein